MGEKALLVTKWLSVPSTTILNQPFTYREWIEQSLLRMRLLACSLASAQSILHHLNHRNKPTISIEEKYWIHHYRSAVCWLWSRSSIVDGYCSLRKFPTRPPCMQFPTWVGVDLLPFSVGRGVFFLIRAYLSNRGSGLNQTDRHSGRMVTSFSSLSSCLSEAITDWREGIIIRSTLHNDSLRQVISTPSQWNRFARCEQEKILLTVTLT